MSVLKTVLNVNVSYSVTCFCAGFVNMDLTCDVCCKSFTTKSNLTMHQKVHQEKSVICPHCDKAFTLPEEPPVTERPSKPAAVQQHRGCTESTKRQLNRKSLTSEQPKQQAEVAPSTESTSTDVAAVVARPSVSVNMSNCYNWCTCYTAWQFITHLEEDWL